MSYFHNPVYIERDYSAEDIGDNLAVAAPENSFIPDTEFDGIKDLYDELPLIAADLPQKATNLKSNLEKTFDEMLSSLILDSASKKIG